MCSIAGFVGEPPTGTLLVGRTADAVARRGPGDRGVHLEPGVRDRGKEGAGDADDAPLLEAGLVDSTGTLIAGAPIAGAPIAGTLIACMSARELAAAPAAA